MRLTFLTHFPGRGGSTVFLQQLRTFFEGRGHHVSVVCGSDARSSLIDRFQVVPPIPHRNWLERRSRYLEIIHGTRPDLVYAISGAEEFDILRFLTVPRAHHIFSLEQHAWIDIPRLIRKTASHTELFTANTPDVLGDILDIAPDSPAARAIAPYRIGAEWFRNSAPQAASHLRICFSGRLDPFQKRAHWLATIIPETYRRKLPIEWHIVGDGPCAQVIRNKAEAAGARAHFHGWLSPGQIRALYLEMDLFFLCSRWEGLPVAMVEAMASGLAALLPRMQGGSLHLLKGEEGGWTYHASRPASAIPALERVCHTPSDLLQRKQQALRIAAENFSPAIVDQQLIDLEETLKRLTFNGLAKDPQTTRPLRRVSALRFLAQRLPAMLAHRKP